MKMAVNMAWIIRNPKSEGRNPNSEKIGSGRGSSFRESDFGFRISDFAWSFQHKVQHQHHSQREQQSVVLKISSLKQAQRAAGEIRAATNQPNAEAFDDPTVDPVHHRRDEIVRTDEYGVKLVEVKTISHPTTERAQPRRQRISRRIAVEHPRPDES